MDQILQLKNKLTGVIERGINGQASIPINDLQILLTNKCNLHCLMCHMCSKEHPNHTYYNDPPFELSLDEYKKLLNISFLDRVKFLFFHSAPKSAPKTIIFSAAESLINQNIYEMIRYTKKYMPSTSIRIISNGTIPLKKENSDMVKLINQIAFSVDGCTAETFEKIRTPARFEHVIKNIKGYVQIKKDHEGSINIVLAFTLSSINAYELPGMVKLAGKLGGIESLWVQPMVILNQSLDHLRSLVFFEMDRSVLVRYINEAFEISNK